MTPDELKRVLDERDRKERRRQSIRAVVVVGLMLLIAFGVLALVWHLADKA